MAKKETEIFIIGGGIAGCIAAISLVEFYRVTLIDKLQAPKDRIGESLAPAAGRILSELNLLDGVENQSPPLFQRNLGMQSYWGSNHLQIVDHMRNPDGFVKSLDRRAFEAYLRKAAEDRGVECLWGASLFASSYEDPHWKVQVRSTNGKADMLHISAQFVIDASGRQSHFARSIGIQRKVEDKLLACWATLPNSTENTMSTISSSANGWWYSSVVPNGKRIVAFHTDFDLIEKSALKTPNFFVDLAQENEQIKLLLQGFDDEIEFRGTTAANSTKLNQVAGKHWTAIGDAAISFDPLSSQGMYNAMASAMQMKGLILQFGFEEELSKAHTSQIDQIWMHYNQHKRMFYKAESRWKTSEFWTRRHNG